MNADQVEAVLAQLSLIEKCALLQGASAFGTYAIDRLDVPALEFSDGPHGMRHQATGGDHLGIAASEPATCFPTAVSVAQSWNPELAYTVGAAVGEEAAAQNVNVVLGPGLNIKRSPLCGRNFEYYSEDPYLAGKMAAGAVRGIQSIGVSACPKHFAANSQETRRQAYDSLLDERTLRELYLTGFEIVTREAHPQCFMTSYNKVNGTYANENPHLLQDILRDEWGFDGAVVSDWGGSNDHPAGVAAGATFEMPNPGMPEIRELMRAVRTGRVSMEVLDARVREALMLNARTHEATKRIQAFDQHKHHELAAQVAEECLVLLKNEADLLPLQSATRVAVIGDFAKHPRYQGAGSSGVNATQVDTLWDALLAQDLELVGYEPGFVRDGLADEQQSADLTQKVLQLAKKAEVVVLCLGLPESREIEGADRSSLELPQEQVDLAAALCREGHRVVVVLSGGAALTTPWLASAQAVLYEGLLGQAGAQATAKALVGVINPSGHLAETWFSRLKDTPSSSYAPTDTYVAEYREGPFVGYRYAESAGVDVVFPFGFGLSYTSFSIANMQVRPDGVSCTVTNTGTRAGAAVVQLYVGKQDSVLIRPVRELKGFTKVMLDAGASREVLLPFDQYTFRYFDVERGSFAVEAGTYELYLGFDARTMLAQGSIERAGAVPGVLMHKDQYPSYAAVQVHEVPDQEFYALLGREVSAQEAKAPLSDRLCICDFNKTFSPLMLGAHAVLKAMKQQADKRGTTNINLLFTWNTPLRSLRVMSGGLVSRGVINGLVAEARGAVVVGLVWAAGACIGNAVRNAITAAQLRRALRGKKD